MIATTPKPSQPSGQLFYSDNFDVLRESIATESVALIYLDPPFKSNADYNVLFRSPAGDGSQAQIEAFEDTWHWGQEAQGAFDDSRRAERRRWLSEHRYAVRGAGHGRSLALLSYRACCPQLHEQRLDRRTIVADPVIARRRCPAPGVSG